jgi:hypothetical protein
MKIEELFGRDEKRPWRDVRERRIEGTITAKTDQHLC